VLQPASTARHSTLEVGEGGEVMASYILRNIDADLWRQIKSKAALEGISVKALIERLLRAWLEA